MSTKFKNAISLFNSGKIDQAREISSEILHEQPKNFQNLNLLAIILFKQKKFDQSINLIKNSLDINPNQADTQNNLGLMYIELKKINYAVTCFKKSIKINPKFLEAYNNLGMALMEIKDNDNALKIWKEALSINENNPQIYNNIGNLLTETNDEKKAVEYYEKAIDLKKDFFIAHYNLGNVLQKLRQFKDSIKSYDLAIKLNFNYAEAYYNRANSYRELNFLDNALNDYISAYKINPDLKNLFGNIVFTKKYLCKWENFNEDVKKLEIDILDNKFVIDPFSLLSILDSPVLQKKNTSKHISKKNISIPKFENKLKSKEIKKKIKIGYYSSDFKIHPVSHLIAGVFEAHDKSCFELYAFSLTSLKNDEMTKRIINAFDHFIDLSKKNTDEIVSYSRNLGIDIAIDLMGFTKFNRHEIFLKKCAPVQINYLGYAGTFGSNSMDYIIADKNIIKDKETSNYSEKIIYLPYSFMATDFKNLKLNNRFDRKYYNLPDDAFVFCCFNKQYKFSPDIFNIWMNLLNEIKNSVLWLKVSNSEAEKNILHEAKKRAISSERIIFAKGVSLEDHLSRYKLADLFLDTFPFGAHTTCVDSLWSGLPVLTRRGDSFPSKVSSSLLRSLELEELITDSNKDYENKALYLSSNIGKLKSITKKLIINSKKKELFNTTFFTKNLEKALKIVYDKNKNNFPTSNIEF